MEPDGLVAPGEACLRKVEITLALALSLSGSFSSFVVRLPLANYC